MGNLEKLAKYGTEDEEKQSKNTTQYVLDITIFKQTQKTQIRHEPPTNNWGVCLVEAEADC
jgi:hypothetical protein